MRKSVWVVSLGAPSDGEVERAIVCTGIVDFLAGELRGITAMKFKGVLGCKGSKHMVKFFIRPAKVFAYAVDADWVLSAPDYSTRGINLFAVVVGNFG